MSETEDGRVKFLEIDINEIQENLRTCIANQKEIRVWAMGEELLSAKLLKMGVRDGQLKLLINQPDIDELYLRSELCLNATVKGVEFCTRGKVTSLEEDNNFILTINTKCYRAEKRLSERLLAFPHHQIYAYFNFDFSQSETSNVLSLNSYKEENKRIFEKFKKARLKDELKGTKDLEDVDIDNLIGFRAMDLSLNGISFLANKEEANFFKNEGAHYNFILLVNGVAYKIKNGKIVYKVDYLNPRAGSASMYKIGLRFDDNHKLRENLKTLIENYENPEQVKIEFEEFLNNNS